MVSDEIEREIRRREHAGRSLESLLGGEVERIDSQGARRGAAQAWAVWNAVNGDVERAHTTGVHVGEPRRGARDPEFTVYVDSNAYLTDFSANREIYLARMETAGLHFSSIAFRRAKGRAAGGTAPSRVASVARAPLPELTPDEERRVSELCSTLPESLRESVSRAMRASLRAQKREHS